MEVEFDLFQRLAQAGAIDDHHVQSIQDYHSGNPEEPVFLGSDLTAQLENGVITGRYLQHVIANMDKGKANGADASKFKQVKDANTPPAKLFNWNLIFKETAKLGIELDKDTQGLINKGDLDMIAELLKRISELAGEKGAYNSSGNEKEEKKSPKKKKVKEGVDILSMDPNKKPNKCDSSLEIILNTLCRNFKMKPKQ